MKIVRSLFRFYIQSSFHVALSVTSLAVITVLELGYVPEPVLLLFIFSGTVAGYNFVKYAGISNRHNLTITSYVNLIRALTVLFFGAFIYFGRILPPDVIIATSIFGGLTVLYAIPFYKSRNLRNLKGIKIFIIAVVWTGVAVSVPVEYHNLRFNSKVIFQCLEIFLFVIALTLPFEIRDLKYDEVALGTIPQKLGIQKTKWLGTLLLMISGILAWNQNFIYESHLTASLIAYSLTLMALWFTREEQGSYYASFFVESIPIVWLILVLFL